MCGTCGVIGIADRGEAESITRWMLAAIYHRGPDDEGLLVVPPVALGIRRLSIIDLPGGHQPVTAADGSTNTYSYDCLNHLITLTPIVDP